MINYPFLKVEDPLIGTEKKLKTGRMLPPVVIGEENARNVSEEGMKRGYGDTVNENNHSSCVIARREKARNRELRPI